MAGENLEDVCGVDGSQLCAWMYDRTGSEFWSGASLWLIDKPLRVAIIVVVAWLISRPVRRSIRNFGAQVVARHEEERKAFETQRGRGQISEQHHNGRGVQRAQTLTSVLSSVAAATIWGIAALMVLGQVGVSVAPLLAGAGVIGVMLAFGAQSVVADFLSGTFMLIEDQFGVGDVIDVGDVTGTVEKVSLRVTTLRDVSGTVWHVPNSEIRRVANLSQLWSRAVLDIEVAYDTDLRRAEGIIQRVANDLWQDVSFEGGDIIDQPEVWGIQNLGPDGVVIRLVVKTDPAEQWAVARELRLRIKEAFDEASIEIPFPQRTVWLRHDDVVARDLRPAVDTDPLHRTVAPEEGG